MKPLLHFELEFTMYSEVKPRRSLESQGDEKNRSAEDAAPPSTLRFEASFADHVLEVAEEELALQVEYVDAQLRSLNQQRVESLDISTFQTFMDSLESEAKLLHENDQRVLRAASQPDFATWAQ
jgi:hypothetical protein